MAVTTVTFARHFYVIHTSCLFKLLRIPGITVAMTSVKSHPLLGLTP
jgi:hypothetical protein